MWETEYKEGWYNGIEIIDSEFFEIGFSREYHKSGYSMWDDAYENICNDLSVLKDTLEDEGYTKTGIYELYGKYEHTWEGTEDYYNGGTEWECDFSFPDINIKKFNREEVKLYLEKMYFEGNKSDIMTTICEFGLDSELSYVRNKLCSHNDIFIYNKEKDKEDICLN